MGTGVNLNGTSYTIPANGEGGWGEDVTNYLIALATGVLAKTGGSFTLTADVDFGANFGLKSICYKSRATASTVGVFRLGNDEIIGWRDAANTADLALKVNSSDVLEFAGNPLVTLALGAAHAVMTMNAGGTAYEWATLTNDNIDASAAIDASKIADGSVSSAEFQFINSLASNAQTQLDAKLDDVGTATDNAIVRFDTNGQALQNSAVIIDDSNNVTGIGNLTLSGDIDVNSAGALAVGASVGANNITLGGATSTVVVAGNLQIDGTTTTVNSTTLDVADANITLNNGGNQASANNTAGVTVEMSDATDVVIIYDSSLASRWKVGDSGGESELVVAGVAQTITAVKTHTANQIMDNQKEIRFEEQSGNGDNYIGLSAPDAVTASKTFKLPDGDGTANQVLKTDGSLNLSWATVAAGIGTNFDINSVSANYTILDADGYRHILVTTSTTDRTITLPTASANTDRMITIKKVDSGSGTVTIDGEGAETIDGEATKIITDQYEKITLVCDGSEWFITGFGLADANNAGLVPKYESGAYTPTYTSSGSSNITAASGKESWYVRIGNVVMVGIKVTIDPTAASTNTLGLFSLPITTTQTMSTDVSGNATYLDTSSNTRGSAIIEGDGAASNFKIRFRQLDASNRNWNGTFVYSIK